MALMECPECGKIVSEHARRCPHCGFEGDYNGEYTLGESTPEARAAHKRQLEEEEKCQEEKRKKWKEERAKHKEEQAQRPWLTRFLEGFQSSCPTDPCDRP